MRITPSVDLVNKGEGKRIRRAAWSRTVLGVLLATGGSSTAFAEDIDEPRDFPVERFHLSTDRNGLMGVEWAGLRSPRSWEVSLWLGYANDPLVLYREVDGKRERVGGLVSSRIGGELAASYAFTSWLQLSVSTPVVLQQDRDSTLSGVNGALASIRGVALGDIRISPKLALLKQGKSPVNLALFGELSLPSGRAKDYRGDSGVSGGGAMLLSRRDGGMKYAASVGYYARKHTEVVNQTVDDELVLRAGAGFTQDRLTLDATVSFATAAASPFSQFNQNHLELIGGPSYDIGGHWIVFAGAGAGLLPGFGTPDFRVLAGLRMGRLSDEADTDGDGLLDSLDRCPREREDRDGYQDSDGCADLDNDGDGVADALDRCPVDAEEQDGFEDTDGCPELDNDQDGLPDASDKCPIEPETVNGLTDDDGCPDVADTDGDGISNARDKCSDAPEDLDTFQDDDGCPDLDNDADGVVDANDACPLVAGVAENKGCADVDGDGDSVVDRLDNCPTQPGVAKHQGCANRQFVVIRDGKLDILDVVYFKFNRDEILAKSNPLLDNVAEVLLNHTEIARIEVQGHTDDRGNDAYNLGLSDRRAKQVMRYLIGKGVPAARLEAKGYGEAQPIADNKTLKGRGANRRVVFLIVGAAGVEQQNSGPTTESMDK